MRENICFNTPSQGKEIIPLGPIVPGFPENPIFPKGPGGPGGPGSPTGPGCPLGPGNSSFTSLSMNIILNMYSMYACI